MMRRVQVMLAAGLVVAACRGRDNDPDDKQPAQPGRGSDETTTKVDGPPKPEVITPQKLSPIIRELGLENVTPTAIVIELDTPIIDRGDVGQVSTRSVLAITPAVPGRIVHTGVSQLTFTPNRPLAFDTSYSVELAKVETKDGVLAPPAGEKWMHSFKTPAFKFLGWAPTDLAVDKHKVTMEVAFSGAVLANIARPSMTFTVNGAAIAGVGMLPSRTPNAMLVQLSDPRITLGSKLGLGIKKDLKAANDAKAPAATAEYVVSGDKAISIKNATIVEGSNGFYVEVVCDDKAAPDGNRSSYDGGGYYHLSERCQLSEDSLSRITFKPAVKKTYITGGRAGFRIFGDFKRGTYAMRIGGGAQSIDGGVVLAAYAKSFSVSARKPQLSFASSGRYLPRKAWSNLGIKHLNVDAVNVIVRHIPAENLVFYLSNVNSEAADDRTSNVVLKKTIPLAGNSDVQTTTWLDVASLLPAQKGVLELKLVAVGSKATARLLLTNMSLVAKKTSPVGKPWNQTVQVWGLDMDSNALLDGVEVSLVRKSGKVVAKCSTDGGAGCKLAVDADNDPDQAEPFALIARRGDDLTYLRYQDLRADVAESNTSGVPYVMEAPYRAALFSDRGVYRPGDTAHVVAIVRDGKDRAPGRPLPVDVKVIDPRAKVVRKLTLKTNPGGMLSIDQALPAFAETGHWRVQLSVADKPLGAHDLQVEEFVPERMKVTAASRRANASIGSTVPIDVTATYLFGGNAADSGVTLDCSVEPERFAPEHNADLVFGIEPKGKSVNLGQAKDQLDPAGKLTIECPEPDEDTTFTQTSTLTARVAVLEAGSGRATTKTTEVTLHPERYYLGLKANVSKAKSGERFSVSGAVVDWTGKLAPLSIKQVGVELAHVEADYGYGYDEDTGESRYDRHVRYVPEGKMTAQVVNGRFTFDVTPGDVRAGYVVRVKAGKTKTELVLEGDYYYDYYYDEGGGYYGGGHVDATPRPHKPTQLKIELPKEIGVGSMTPVKAKTPYKGKILWTVETDRVIKSEWRDATGAESTWGFALSEFAPNVYVSAFLVKDPHLESKDAFLPDRAFGVQSARVTPTDFTQAVTIDAPKEIRSASPLKITLNVPGGPTPSPTWATVAVVDEGILSLTGFQTPDPLATLFQKRRLGVETFETIGWTMLHQPAGTSSKTGGGDEGMEDEEGGGPLAGGRVQPVKPVALWSGVLPVGSNGKLTVPFVVPTYRGQLRVMAVTSSAQRVGRAEAKVLVRDPLVVQTTFPRFVTHDDEIQIPVFLTNMSGGPLDVSVTLSSEHIAIAGLARPKTAAPPIAFTGKDTGTIKLENGRAETVVFAAKAAMPIGAAKLRVVAKANSGSGTFEVKEDLDVPFLPAGPKERVLQKFKVDAGTVNLTQKATALKGWVPTSETTTFWLTANPYGESFDHLKYLIRYPYGCIEQTTSSTRPLLYVANLVELIDPHLADLKIEDMVLSGVNRILSMETPSGGFGYWPGATEPVDWGTAYATHMLIDAKNAGYAVPDDRLRAVIAWIDGRVATYESNTGAARTYYQDEHAEVYLHYVLALAGKGKKGRIEKLIANINANATGQLAEDLYMLKAALYLAGNRRYAADLKAVDASPIAADRNNSWSFYSDQRRRGMQLSIFHDLFKADPLGEPLAQRVADTLSGKHSGYYNTQELVWSLTGLGKWVGSMAAKGVADGKLIADGTPITARAPKRKTNDKAWAVVRASEYKDLVLEVPAQAAGLWLVVSSEGVRAGAQYKVGGNGLDVTRTYRDVEGTQVDLENGDDVKLGDVLYVEVELENTSGATIQNIALIDRLPAGFEIENPRLGRGAKLDWVENDDVWAYDYMNVRDDRFEAFGSLQPRASKKIVYTVRATTSGKFTIPPVEAEAMYDPTLWARDKGGTAVVGGPWTGKTI